MRFMLYHGQLFGVRPATRIFGYGLAMALTAFCTPSIAVTPAQLGHAYAVGEADLTNHDFASAAATFKFLLRLAPNQPAFMQAYARSQAGLGLKAEALATYGRVVALGYGARLVDDPVFSTLQGENGYRALRTVALEQSHPITPAIEAFRLPERNFIPEGMAWDSRTGHFYLSSTYLRKVSKRDDSGYFHNFTPSAAHGMWQALGMKVDARRRWLMVCSGDDDRRMVGFRNEDLGKSGIFIYDIDTGDLVARHVLGATGRHLFNDLVQGPGEKLYITDSDEGTVYSLNRAAGKFTRMTPANRFTYPNGIAISPDGRTLYVADAVGIEMLDIASLSVRRLSHAADVTLVGIDGLYFRHGYLVATQTGVKPYRVMAFHLVPTLDRVDWAIVLERGDPRMSSPTEGVIVGDWLYFIANSQQDAFDSDDRIWPQGSLRKTVVLRVHLPDGRAHPHAHDSS